MSTSFVRRDGRLRSRSPLEVDLRNGGRSMRRGAEGTESRNENLNPDGSLKKEIGGASKEERKKDLLKAFNPTNRKSPMNQCRISFPVHENAS